jgi:5-methylcytosine-specific restriction endonuclease McrA
MPFDRKLYPEDWEQISLAVREDAGWRCEFCVRIHGQPHPVTGSRVVLTVAHLDHNPQHSERSNLRALCQRCHLRYDTDLHRRHASETKRKRLIEAGQLTLWG